MEEIHEDVPDVQKEIIRPEMSSQENKSPFKRFLPIIIVVAVLLVGVVGFLLFRKPSSQTQSPIEKQEQEEVLEQVDPSIEVSVTWSKTKDNTVVLVVKGLAGKYTSVGYELQYDSEGVGKGVTSGSKPIDVTGQDMFEREIYLGTCSKNVCKPDPGVTNVSVVLEFTATDGKKSQFSKDYDL
jgi:hypothetical protein